MKAVMTVQKPEDIQITINITMPVKEWRELADQLGNKFPSHQLSALIRNATRQVEKNVYVDGENVSTY